MDGIVSEMQRKLQGLEEKLSFREKSDKDASNNATAELRERISQLEIKLAEKEKISSDVGYVNFSNTDHQTESPPRKSGVICSTIWGGPIMPSDDQNLW